MELGREQQAAWVANQQKTATIPAPPGTLVCVFSEPVAPVGLIEVLNGQLPPVSSAD